MYSCLEHCITSTDPLMQRHSSTLYETLQAGTPTHTSTKSPAKRHLCSLNSYACKLLRGHSCRHGLSLPVFARLWQVQKLGESLLQQQLEVSFACL